MSCCGGSCGCGSGCSCGSGCGSKMYPDVEMNKTTATIITGVAPKKTYHEGVAEKSSGAEGGHGCKCGPSCGCDPCTC